ncbi:uncharacterized protein LOC131939360 [Physella acuta]|uniref:uncharacterized protein LOC131939360 n=1 Tax=Physella acuta TaxID=109671 RepID=UPI0027DDBEA1|nr:uncharacterized protein LOC131939360 [Physella acuta]XP_059153739.1 uncharacterized protein LOC131939360 [Physella acuta]
MASGLDMKKVCLEWFHSNPEYRNFQPEINLGNLKLTLETPTWSQDNLKAQKNGPTRKVTLKYGTNMTELYSDLKIEKNSEVVDSVTIQQGKLLGINKEVEISLPNNAQRASVKVNVGRDIVEESRNGKPIKIQGGRPSTIGGTVTATISPKECSFTGQFQCNARLSGDVIFTFPYYGQRAQEQQNIVQIIRDLQSPSRDDIKMFEAMFDHIRWPLKGEVELRWDGNYDVTWN